MKRMAFVELEQWKTSPNRKPLLIRGARQVGKTYHNGSPRGIRFSSQNFAIDNHIHSYPLYAVFKLIPPDPAVLRSFLS